MALDTTGVPEPLASGLQAAALTDPVAAQVAVTAYLNLQNLLGKAQAAVTNNVAYLAIGAPTNAQVVAQVAALTRQVDALIRIAVASLDSTAGT